MTIEGITSVDGGEPTSQYKITFTKLDWKGNHWDAFTNECSEKIREICEEYREE